MEITPLWNGLIVGPLEWILTTLARIPGVGGGLAIILMTVLIKSILLPFSIKQTSSMKAMQALQPDLAAVKQRYKDDREKITQETMRLYKERGVNPAAGCLPMLPTMVVLFGLYWALQNLAHSNAEGVCEPPCNPDFQASFLWVSALNHPDVVTIAGFPIPGILPILMAISQFFSSKMMAMPSADPQQAAMSRMTTVIMPAMMLFWGVSFPAGLVLYWFVSNIFEMVRLYFAMGPDSLRVDLRPQAIVAGIRSTFAFTSADGAASSGGSTSRGENSGGDSRAASRSNRLRSKRGRRSGRR